MKTKTQQLPYKTLKTTVFYGYALYVIFVLSQILFVTDTLPRALGGAVSNERIIALYVGLVGSLLLPPLFAFLIGYFATTKTKVPYLRRYSGVVAGICSLWLSLALSTVIYRFAIPHPDYIPLQVYQFGYAIIAVIIMLAIGVSYVIVQSKQIFPLYKPLAFVLMGSIVAWFIFNLTGGHGGISILGESAPRSTLDMILIIESIACIPVIFGLSYYFSPIKTSGIFNKITFASILTALYLSTLLAIGMLFTSKDIMGSFQHFILLSVISYPVALIIWGAYIRIIKQQVK